jgi:hypothetical protein
MESKHRGWQPLDCHPRFLGSILAATSLKRLSSALEISEFPENGYPLESG